MDTLDRPKRLPTLLSVGRPDVAAQWHPALNGDLTPADVSIGSGIRVWWVCPEDSGHNYQARVYHRVAGRGCSYCAGRSANHTNSLAALRPDLATEWHPRFNGDLTPGDVTLGSNRVVHWSCSADSAHVWPARVVQRVKGTGCPECAAEQRFGAQDEVYLSEIRPELAGEFHPSLNGDRRFVELLRGSTETIWWVCPKEADHVWASAALNRGRGSGCPYCAGKAVNHTNCLATLRPELAAQWHPSRNGKLGPQDVTEFSHELVWWRCDGATTHVWQSPVFNRSIGHGCARCRSVDNS